MTLSRATLAVMLTVLKIEVARHSATNVLSALANLSFVDDVFLPAVTPHLKSW